MFHRTPILFAATIALMACGNSNSSSDPIPSSAQQPAATAPIEAPPKVAAAPPSVPTVASVPATAAVPKSAAVATSASTTQPESARCLELVGKSAFTEAVPVCVRASGLDPDNAAVKQALETARAKAATAALGSAPAIPDAGKLAAGIPAAK